MSEGRDRLDQAAREAVAWQALDVDEVVDHLDVDAGFVALGISALVALDRLGRSAQGIVASA